MTADRPFVARPVTDRAAAEQVARRAARTWGLRAPEPMRSGMNALFVCGDVVLRVGHTTADPGVAHRLAGWLLATGVPTVEPLTDLAGADGDLGVTAWRRVVSTGAPIDWASVGGIVRRVHELDPGTVPGGYPVPDPTTFPWWDFASLLDDLAPDLDAAALIALRTTVERHAGWADRVRRSPVLCHGDVHSGNVLMTADGPLLLDWDLLCLGDPAWDHAQLTVAAERWGGDPSAYPAFLAGYGEPSVDPELAAGLGELRNVAATLMRLRAGRHDAAAAAEAAHRLRYWRGETTEAWHAQ